MRALAASAPARAQPQARLCTARAQPRAPCFAQRAHTRCCASCGAMPGGPVLGLGQLARLFRRGQHNNRAAVPPHVMLLSPARQRAYGVQVHRSGAAGDTSEAEPEEPAQAAQAAQAAPRAEAAIPAPRWQARAAFAALMAWLVMLGSMPSGYLFLAAAWPAYLWALNRWRFDSNAVARERPMYPLLIGACVRGGAWCGRGSGSCARAPDALHM
jgi:hypothetical protein